MQNSVYKPYNIDDLIDICKSHDLNSQRVKAFLESDFATEDVLNDAQGAQGSYSVPLIVIRNSTNSKRSILLSGSISQEDLTEAFCNLIKQ